MKILFCLLLALFGFSCSQSKAQNKVSPNDFETLLNNDPSVQLVDVRTPTEYQSGHIAGAKNINIHDADFAQQISTLDKTKPVLVYCARGGRSASAAEQLLKSGFQTVHDLDGGMGAWKAAGKKVVR